LVVVLPNFEEFVLEKLEPGMGWNVAATYFMLLLASAAHLVAFFQLMGKLGAVATGILQAARSIVVFLMSDVLFCETHEEQCFTRWKGASVLVVVVSILYFSRLPPPAKLLKESKEEKVFDL
jgi:NhaP-type Na+/H+ or K+/H+ antiporter